MGIFTKPVTKAAISEPPKVQAALGFGGTYSKDAIGAFYQYTEGTARAEAMTLASVSRSRDLLVSVIQCMPLKMYGEMFDDATGEMTEIPLAPRSWLRQPDPSVTFGFIMGFTLDDLLFYGRAFWYVTERTQDGFPSKFTRLPAGSVTTLDQAGPVWFGPSKEIVFAGNTLDARDVIQFLSPIQGIVYSSAQTIATAMKIEQSRYKNAQSSLPSGVLKQTGGEPLSAQELSEIGAAFQQARLTNQTAVLNEFLSYDATTATPDKMLMIESAQYSSLDLSRLCGVPPYLLGISSGSYAYTSSAESRKDLYIFGVKNYSECISSTLSMNNVLPRGTYCRFDADSYLIDNYTGDTLADPMSQQPQQNTQESLA